MPTMSALLVRYAPVLYADSADRFMAAPLTIYGCQAGRWLQFWLPFAGDRDHEGTDWEMVMLLLDGGVPVVAACAQHRWARARAYSRVRLVNGHWAVFVGRDKHASYFGTGWHRHGRHWERSNGRVWLDASLRVEVPAAVRGRLAHRDPDAWLAARLRGWRPRALR